MIALGERRLDSVPAARLPTQKNTMEMVKMSEVSDRAQPKSASRGAMNSDHP